MTYDQGKYRKVWKFKCSLVLYSLLVASCNIEILQDIMRLACTMLSSMGTVTNLLEVSKQNTCSRCMYMW